MHKSPDIASYQQQFADSLRNPQQPAPPQADPQRIAVYQRLVYNNFCSFIDSCFPISRTIVTPTEWQQLCRSAFAEIRSDSPLFRDIPAQFLHWLQPKALQLLPHYPWLWEFLHYEWLELQVETHPAATITETIATTPQQPLQAIPLLNPTLTIACYNWPVATISADTLPTEPLTTLNCFAVVRNHLDNVQFIALNPLTAQLLQLLQQYQQSINLTLQTLAQQVAIADSSTLHPFVEQLLQQMQQQQIIIGWQHTSASGDSTAVNH